MKSVIVLFLFSSILLSACHTTANVRNMHHLEGKRIGIGEIKLSTAMTNSRDKVDTLCDCIVSSFSSAMNPFFQKAGLVLIDIPGSRKNSSEAALNHLIDSLHLDYLVIGNGLIQVQGTKHPAYFMHDLSIQIMHVNSREIIATGEFSGAGVYPTGAIQRISKKMLKGLK